MAAVVRDRKEYQRRYRAANPEYWRAYKKWWRSEQKRKPCPDELCMTWTPGGRLCHFCRRTP